jgi:regulator of protease activity HflC (stomatin/prohibitin superfamily)
MLTLKYILIAAAVLLFASAVAIVVYDLWFAFTVRRRNLLAAAPEERTAELPPLRWRTSLALVLVAWMPLLLALSIVVIRSGEAGVKVSQLSGTRAGTLYPGVHLITPLMDHVETFSLRDRIFTTGAPTDEKAGQPDKPSHQATPGQSVQPLTVQAKEGLTLGLAVTVRYQLDPRRLDYIQSHLPQPVETEIVPPVVAATWRELAPSYTVREIFSTNREQVRQQAAQIITRKLGSDGIIVKEVLLRDIQLPPEYAKGLEKLLLKEQENDQLSVQTEIQQKQVRISELEAEAQKVTQIKQAEGDAQSKVLEAKGESDAMQYTLPLKQKQIEQSRLEAEARKETTIKGAEANAEAKLLDSRAEMERRKLLAEAEAHRIRVTAVADAERMRGEADVLKGNPLLINKIIAEKLSDKIQLMMVPTDSKFFFANDVFKGMTANTGNVVRQQMDPDEGK